MTVEMARNGDIEIAYERFGMPDGEPLLLVMALGMPMICWHDEFCAELAACGYSVARFDNRDSGLSTHVAASGVTHSLRVVVQPAKGAPYRLEDMAADGVAVLDALGWESAHVVGLSLGGMIAQMMAIAHPSRVRTLTSLLSMPGWRLRRMKYKRLFALTKAARAAGPGRAGRGQLMVDMFRAVGSPAYALDEVWLRNVGERSYDCDPEPLFQGWSGPLTATERQALSVGATGDLLPALRSLRLPTLVVRGDADPLVRASAATSIVDAIPGARLVSYPGLGHDLPRELWPAIIDEIRALARRAA